MKKIKHLVLLFCALSLFACDDESRRNNSEDSAKVDDTEAYAALENCDAPASWFAGNPRNTPPPNEGPTSPFANNDSVTNCDFHQWSWQKFLWLTNEVNGKPLFMDQLIQVTSSGGILPQNSGIILVDTAQASNPTDILRTPGINGKVATTVYYTIFIDSSMLQSMQTNGPIAISNPSQLADSTYPVGALEVKTAWIDANALADTSTYFITDGTIAGVPARVALLGIHVVGIVENHPEFVWATFEHDSLAPMYDWSLATDSTDASVTSTTDYPFFNKNSIATIQNIITPNQIFTDVYSVYPYGTPVVKEMEGQFNVLKYMETSQPGFENFHNIKTINESVKGQLTGIWNNYFYNGSLWINTEKYVGVTAQAQFLDSIGLNLSGSDTNDLTRGSVAAYNITMETYVQVGFGQDSIHSVNSSNLANCFSCHNADDKSNLSPLNLSQVFTAYVDSLNGLSKVEIKQAHVDEIKRQFYIRSLENSK